jgi:hypothetical protein
LTQKYSSCYPDLSQVGETGCISVID